MALENVGSIEYDARIQTSKLRADAAEVDRLAKGAGDSIGDHTDRGSNRAGEALQKFARVAAVALAAAGVAAVAFGVSSAKAFIESENAIAQTNAVLKSTNQVAGVTAKTVTDLANSLQRQSTYSDETIRSAENMLLTFTNIGKKTFPSATQAVLDMSTAMGTDLKSTAIQVGKALQDPVLGATALQRVGVRLTQSQKDLIQSLVSSGDAAGAQAVILKELQTEFGGSAKAAGETFAGRLAILKNQLNDVQEAIGGMILKGITPVIGSLLSWYDAAGGVDGILKTLGTTLSPIANSVLDVASKVGDYLMPKLSALWTTIRNEVIPAVSDFARAFGPAAGAGLVAFLGLTIDALNILLTIVTPVINYLSENTWIVWGIVAAFAAWKAILFIDAAVTSFRNAMNGVILALQLVSGEAVVTTGKMATLRTAMGLLVGPWQIAIGIVGVGIVLASLQQIQGALEKLTKGFEDLKNKKVNVGGMNVSGTSDLGIIQQLRNSFGYRASGGSVSAGMPYIVGEKQPELFVPRTAGTILPEVPTGNSSSSVTVNINMSGIMTRSRSDERDVARSLIERLNESLRAKGVAEIGGGALV